jgi:hypothetical protein
MDEFLAGLICGLIIMGIILLISLNVASKLIEEKMQKEAISHGAAHYEVNANGVVSFKWNK